MSNAPDQEALLGFLSTITYDPSHSLTAWKPNVSFCEWIGVMCSRRRQRVVALNVSDMGLQEYGLVGRVTTKGDVYSYGIVLLEMMTGKKPTHNMFVEGPSLQNWVGSNFPNRVGEVVDKSLLSRTSTSIEEEKNLNCLSQLLSVGLLCTKESPEGRPTMIDIMGTLQSIKDTFLGVTRNPKIQSDITHLLGNTSTTHNNAGESQSSSTF
uniref:Leucine-rich repeat-containing N-terminal plant-type domain-containing protein n=1 Tax=Picea sitchensis TaxID=3332 RepID=A9P0Z3_PICSI|nr:unknown [Picea sitchensis]